MKFLTLAIISFALWISALTMFICGISLEGLELLKLVAIPEALAAVVFTFLAVRKGVSI